MAVNPKWHLSEDEIKQGFTHKALAFGIAPIYFNYETSAVCVRNWWPEWILDACEVMFNLYCDISGESLIPIKLQGEIK